MNIFLNIAFVGLIVIVLGLYPLASQTWKYIEKTMTVQNQILVKENSGWLLVVTDKN